MLNPRTLRPFHGVARPVTGPLQTLQHAISALHALDSNSSAESVVTRDVAAGFDFLTLNVQHTVKTKLVELRQPLQWAQYPAVLMLEERGQLPPNFMFHCLYWHTFTLVPFSSAGVAILVRRDSQLQVGDFTHHPEGMAIVLNLVYRGTPLQVVNAYFSARGTAKEYCLLLQW